MHFVFQFIPLGKPTQTRSYVIEPAVTAVTTALSRQWSAAAARVNVIRDLCCYHQIFSGRTMTLPKGASVVAPVVICICISYSMTSLAITRYKEIYGHNPWCHESSIAALTGLIVGGAIKFYTGSAVEFDNDVFFYVVLPPIIFSAGMSLKKKMFFRYISLITLFGVMGTVINFSLITAATYHATR